MFPGPNAQSPDATLKIPGLFYVVSGCMFAVVGSLLASFSIRFGRCFFLFDKLVQKGLQWKTRDVQARNHTKQSKTDDVQAKNHYKQVMIVFSGTLVRK